MANQLGRVAIIGVGGISDWHARALKIAGLEVSAVATRSGSRRLREFAERHAVAQTFDDWRALLQQADQFDAFVIATRVEGTAAVLAATLRAHPGAPILVEKPVAWTSSEVEAVAKQAHGRVMVAYNRRFYRTVQQARREVRAGGPLLANLMLPESITPNDDPNRHYLLPFLENSCHGLDLARFLFGDLRIERVDRIEDAQRRLSALAAIFSSGRGDIVQFTANWGTPANFALSLNRHGRRFDLLPFELGTAYQGMDVFDPSDEFPIRRYVPRPVERVHLDEIDLREKPGFVKQAEGLRQMIEGQPIPPDAATLQDAVAALRFCEELLGPHVPVSPQ